MGVIKMLQILLNIFESDFHKKSLTHIKFVSYIHLIGCYVYFDYTHDIYVRI